MMQLMTRLTKVRVLEVVIALAMLFAASTAYAGTRAALGVGGVQNPSVAGANSWERGPMWVNTNVTIPGSGASTSPGKTFTLPPGNMILTGHNQRAFPTFAFVAQNSFSFMTTQPYAEQFKAGGGAAALNSIQFCPPLNNATNDGNLSCPGYSNPGIGNRPAFIGIDQVKSPQTPLGTPAANAFGGTLRMGRNVSQAAVWFGKPPFCPNPPSTALGPNGCVQIVSKQPNSGFENWTPGLTNYEYITGQNPNGAWWNAWLTTNKAQISTLLDCSGASCVPAGSAAPTIMAPVPTNNPNDVAWGFKMTTGIVSGSDIYPPVGPNTPYFTFVSTGQDTTTGGGERNIVMIGGSIALSGASGSLFNRVSQLQLTLEVPEPATSAALAAGMLGLIALARLRRSN